LKEGRKPMAGPPAGDEDLSVPLSSSSNRYVQFETQPDVF
jgi:vacuolar protein sorting-associated protein VTA1